MPKHGWEDPTDVDVQPFDPCGLRQVLHDTHTLLEPGQAPNWNSLDDRVVPHAATQLLVQLSSSPTIESKLKLVSQNLAAFGSALFSVISQQPSLSDHVRFALALLSTLFLASPPHGLLLATQEPQLADSPLPCVVPMFEEAAKDQPALKMDAVLSRLFAILSSEAGDDLLVKHSCAQILACLLLYVPSPHLPLRSELITPRAAPHLLSDPAILSSCDPFRSHMMDIYNLPPTYHPRSTTLFVIACPMNILFPGIWGWTHKVQPATSTLSIWRSWLLASWPKQVVTG